MRDDATSSTGLSVFERPLWLSQSLSPGSPHLNVSFLFWFKEGLDAERFARAWREVVARQPMLRSQLRLVDGAPMRAQTAGSPELVMVDVRGETDSEAAARSWCVRRAATVMPISEHMVETALLRYGEGSYAWFLNCHHLITDGITSRLLYEMVAQLYEEGCANAATRAQDASYNEAVAQLTGTTPGARLTRARRYWASCLGDASRRSEPYGRPPLPSHTESRRFTIALNTRQARSLSQLLTRDEFRSISPQLSLFVVFATLLGAWLARVCDRDVVDFDVPLRNRSTLGARRSLGAFIEFFPFRVECRDDDSFLALAARCKAMALDQARHAIPGTSPLTAASSSNIALNFVPEEFDTFGGITPNVEWIHSGHTDLAHSVRVQVERFSKLDAYRIHLDLNQEIFPDALAHRAYGHFAKLLDGLLEDPARAISSLDILGHEERSILIDEFNRRSVLHSPEASVVERWRAQCQRSPDATAVRDSGRRLSFGELRSRVDTLACELRARGVEPGHNVLVLMPRSIESVIAILAIASLRAAFVPADPTDPVERVTHVARDCGARLALVLCGRETDGSRHGLGTVSVGLDALATGPVPSPAESVRLSDRAYVIYTSGSTGAPKGIPVDHSGLADYIDWAERHYVRGRRWSFALFSSLSFDLTMTSLFLPLVSGGTLVVYPFAEGPVDTSLMDVLNADVTEFLKVTPSHLALLRRRVSTRSRLRCIVVGGEDFRTELARDVAGGLANGVEIYNEYGPTETVVGCMIHRYDPDLDSRASVPIGRPAGSTRLYVLNGDCQPVPEGVPGELFIARQGMTAGYLNREDLNESRFLDSPFRDGERLYRSGDLVRFARPGVLEYLGRTDRQLKISGVRVEAGEIEAAILDFPGIAQCVVGRTGSSRPRDAWREPDRRCETCGLPDNFPGADIDDDGVCGVCRKYARIRDQAQAYFRSRSELAGVIEAAVNGARGQFDCMMLYSGGKDSTYALCQLVDLGFRVYAFTLDNGYLSPGAKDNIIRVAQTLGIHHEFAQTEHMREIFRDSLERFSNVCNGCFKTIYTLSMLRARALGIKVIVTGLSRGQFFETRLSEDVFRAGAASPADIDAAVLEARKAYHRLGDAVSRCIDTRDFDDDEIFESVNFVDFYRYWSVSLEEIYSYLSRKTPWIRPHDTGRSTNCLINDVGIHVHKKERGFHNYALPYSWDVRLGQKTRDEAVQELDDVIDETRVTSILTEIGYEHAPLSTAGRSDDLVAWYVADEEVPQATLRRHLLARLLPSVVPSLFVRVEHIPLMASGKVDFRQLAATSSAGPESSNSLDPPQGDAEQAVARIWGEVLARERLGATQSFFELGGTSLSGMDVMLRLNEAFDIDLPLKSIFLHPTIRKLASDVEEAVLERVEAMSEEAAAAELEGRGHPS